MNNGFVEKKAVKNTGNKEKKGIAIWDYWV
jgi:hypothetical protein